ncbi:IS66 family insertion sequence element accessory protein TnpB [Pseudomonas sp. R4-84]
MQDGVGIWLAARRLNQHLARYEPMDIRAGTETAPAGVVAVFGAAQPHCAYLFTNRCASQWKVLVHDGASIRLVARRLNQGSVTG